MKLKSLLSIKFWNSLLWKKVGEYKGIRIILLDDPYICKEVEVICGSVYQNRVTRVFRIRDRRFKSRKQVESFLSKQFNTVYLTFYH